MSMSSVTNGSLLIQGYQTALANGSQAIGPFSIPLSALGEATVIGANSTNVATLVPSVTGITGVGCAITTAPAVSGATYSSGFISNQLTRINPSGYPSIWIWDPAAIPTNVYVTVSNTSGAYVVLQFF